MAALVVGWASGNSPGTVILRATVVMVLCWFIGQGIGALFQRVVDDHIDSYKSSHPLPPMTPVLEEQETDDDEGGQATPAQEDQPVTAPPAQP